MHVTRDAWIKKLRKLDDEILDIHSKICEALCDAPEQPRAAQLQRADGTPAIELLRRIINSVDNNDADIPDDIYEDASSVLKTADVR